MHARTHRRPSTRSLQMHARRHTHTRTATDASARRHTHAHTHLQQSLRVQVHQHEAVAQLRVGDGAHHARVGLGGDHLAGEHLRERARVFARPGRGVASAEGECARVYGLAQGYTHGHELTHVRARTLAHTTEHARTHTHTHSHTRSTPTNTHTRTYTNRHTHTAQTHTHTQSTYTLTHTHSHAPAAPWWSTP